jgi:hypothetical protein
MNDPMKEDPVDSINARLKEEQRIMLQLLRESYPGSALLRIIAARERLQAEGRYYGTVGECVERAFRDAT